MLARPGCDGSSGRVAGPRATPTPQPVPCPRPSYRLRFADGGQLELGRRTAVMAVLNVTPDSFSDGGLHRTPTAALRAAERMVAEGAELIDVGGESTRPGATPIDAEEETRRVLPVIAAIRRELGVRISVDTMKAVVARRAFDAGADMLNDISALGDPATLPLLREYGAPVVLMHMRGTPATMQADTRYVDLIGSIVEFLRQRVTRAIAGGVAPDRILVDPGFGFGKSTSGNLALLAQLPALATLDCPILIGVSRKRFIGELLDRPVDGRLAGSLAAAGVAAAQGAHIVRAHDVAATVQALCVIDAIRGA